MRKGARVGGGIDSARDCLAKIKNAASTDLGQTLPLGLSTWHFPSSISKER